MTKCDLTNSKKTSMRQFVFSYTITTLHKELLSRYPRQDIPITLLCHLSDA